jgi:RecA/RadA recombinase
MPRKKKGARSPVQLKADADAVFDEIERQSPGAGQRLGAMAKVASSITSFKPASEVLTKVRAHPTIFPLYDRATGVGGHPIERIALVHGPSNHGKTAFVHGLGLSFLRAGNFYAYVDAEYTTPEDWLRMLMKQFAKHPGFLAQRPKSYEQTVDSVREFVTKLATARDKGDLDPETTGIVVIDSVRKLVPKDLFAKLMKSVEKHGMDGASGRGAMIKAALNAQWLDELVPLLFHTGTALVFIAREYEQGIDLSKLHEPGGGHEYKVGGGKAMVFESSIVGRVTRSWVKEGSGDDARVVGERHTITITKTKVSGKQHKVEKGFFHTSNGVLIPAGFDRARDVLELATDSGHVVQSGSWLKCDVLGKKWQGISKAVAALTADEALLDTLEGEARGAA